MSEPIIVKFRVQPIIGDHHSPPRLGGMEERNPCYGNGQPALLLIFPDEAARAQWGEPLTAIRAFLAQWGKAEPALNGACVIAQIHGCPYSGPSLQAELEALRRAVTLPAPPPEDPR